MFPDFTGNIQRPRAGGHCRVAFARPAISCAAEARPAGDFLRRQGGDTGRK
jgi:hypothetical protein